MSRIILALPPAEPNLKRLSLRFAFLMVALAIARPAAAAPFQWVLQFGTPQAESFSQVSADRLGHIYVFGRTSGDLPGAIGTGGLVLAKYEATGTLTWVHQFGAPADFSTGLAADGLGNIFLTSISRIADVNHTFVSKYDAAGTFHWTQEFEPAPELQFSGSGIATDGLGNAFIAGTSSNLLNDSSSVDGVVAKYNGSGELQWTRNLDSGQIDNAHGVATDNVGGVYVTGQTTGNLGGPHAGAGDVYVAKFDAHGTLQWTRQLGSNRSEVGRAISTDGLGHVYVAGFTQGSFFAPNSGWDLFVTKFAADGTFAWGRQVGKDGGVIDPHAISADPLGNVFVIGDTSVDLAGQIGSIDVFAQHYDALGNLRATYQFGSIARDAGQSVTTDGLGNAYFSGYTHGDFGGPNAGGTDAWLVAIPEPVSVLLSALALCGTTLGIGRSRYTPCITPSAYPPDGGNYPG